MARREEYARYREYYRTYNRNWARNYYREHAAKMREHNRAYYAKHRDKYRKRARERMSAYRKRPEAKALQRRWMVANRDRVRELHRRWNKENRDKVLAQKRESWQRNKAKDLRKKRERYLNDVTYRMSAIARAAARNPTANHRKRSNDDETFTPQQWSALCKKFHNRCAMCGKICKPTVDHIIPLSRGGSNCVENIQPLCLPCNSKKGSKLIRQK